MADTISHYVYLCFTRLSSCLKISQWSIVSFIFALKAGSCHGGGSVVPRDNGIVVMTTYGTASDGADAAVGFQCLCF